MVYVVSLVHQRVSNSWLWRAGSRQQKRHRQDPKLCCSMWHLSWTWILQIYDSEYSSLLGNTYGFLPMLHVVWVWPMEPLPANDQKILTLPLNFKLQHFRISQITTSIFCYHHFVNNPWNKYPNMRCDMKQKKQLQHGSFRGSRSSEIPRVSSGRSGPCLANSCRYKRGWISHTLPIHPEKPIEKSLFHTFFLNS